MAVFQRDRDREKREGESELRDGGGKKERLIDCNLENVGFWMIGWCSNRVFETCYFSDVPSNNLKHSPMIPSSSIRKWIYQFFFLLVTMKTTASTSEYYQCWTPLSLSSALLSVWGRLQSVNGERHCQYQGLPVICDSSLFTLYSVSQRWITVFTVIV